ncbi:TonB-dependent receptor [Sulfurimonas sp.]|uniref:TonB-dependent receptor n=1 Tax=Sulfurimonas sp. TaxID=2022749 RepID=UPI003D0F87C4
MEVIRKKGIAILAICALALNLGATDLGSISVESSTINFSEADPTEVSTVNYIDSERIEEVAPKQLNELLNQIPGVTADFQEHEEVEIHIRGVGQQEFMWEDTGVALIIDGVPVYTKSGSYRLNLSDIKSIKVIKGSASYLYGNTATAGAVVITTSRPKGDKNKITASTEFGSYNYRDFTGEAQYSTENYAVNINANHRTNDGYWLDSEEWSKSIGGKFSYFVTDNIDVTLGIDKTKKYEQGGGVSVKGVDEAELNPRGTAASSFVQNEDKDLDKYFVKYNQDFDFGANLVSTVYYYLDNYEYDSSPQDIDLNGDPMDTVATKHSITKKDQRGLKLEYKQEINNFAYMVGYDYRDILYKGGSETTASYLEVADDPADDNVSHYAGETSFTNDKQKLHAFYGEVKYAFTDKFNATFNMRRDIQKESYDSVETNYDAGTDSWATTAKLIEKTYKNNSYRLGGVYNVSKSNAFYANVSTGYRTPQMYLLWKYDSVADLKTQTTLSYEIGNRGKMLDHEYEIALFQIDTKDTIGFENGTYAFGGTIKNIGDARNRGLELSVKSDSKEVFSYTIAYTYLDSEVTNHDPLKYGYGSNKRTYDIVGNDLPRVPHHKLDVYTTYKPLPQWKIISELYTQSSYYADEVNLIKMRGYTYLNLQTRYNMKFGEQNLEVFAKINNFFDNQYYRTVYMTQDGDASDVTIRVDPGRMYYAGLKYSF